MRTLLLGAIALILGACGPSIPSGYAPIEGDIVFQPLPRSPLVDAIEGASQIPISHCGIVVTRGEDLFVLEAFGTVHETPLADPAARLVHAAVVHARSIK